MQSIYSIVKQKCSISQLSRGFRAKGEPHLSTECSIQQAWRVWKPFTALLKKILHQHTNTVGLTVDLYLKKRSKSIAQATISPALPTMQLNYKHFDQRFRCVMRTAAFDTFSERRWITLSLQFVVLLYWTFFVFHVLWVNKWEKNIRISCHPMTLQRFLYS